MKTHQRACGRSCLERSDDSVVQVLGSVVILRASGEASDGRLNRQGSICNRDSRAGHT